MRRLPVYLLIDCSESMVGDAINAVQLGVETLLSTLRSDPQALETAHVSVITFSNEAEQIIPLTELTQIQMPRLVPSAGTSLGKAFSLLRNCIEGEVKKSTASQKGDHRPLVFLLTDGQPTDDWRIVMDSIHDLTEPRVANFYSIGCGEDIDYDTLNEMSDYVFKLDDMEPAKLKKLFIWLTASIQNASAGVGAFHEYEGIDLSKKPEEVVVVPKGSHERYTGPPLQVFLKGMCINEQLPYLMRFRLQQDTQMYAPVQSHRLDAEAKSKSMFDVPEINSSMLMGVPPCPHCPNDTIGVCGCGSVMCLPESPPHTVICPVCDNEITFSDDGYDFSIQQSAG